MPIARSHQRRVVRPQMRDRRSDLVHVTAASDEHATWHRCADHVVPGRRQTVDAMLERWPDPYGRLGHEGKDHGIQSAVDVNKASRWTETGSLKTLQS